VLNRPDCAQLLKSLHQLSDQYGVVNNDWNGFNVLQASGGTTGALDLGFVSTKSKHISENDGLKVVYNLGSETTSSYDSESGKKFVIYQGHHGDAGAAGADIVLPGAAYTEKDATYVNTEGRAQRALAAVAPPGLARADWKILRAVSEFAMVPLKYNTIEQCRERLAEVSPTFNAIDDVEPSLWLNGASYAHLAGGTPTAKGKKTSGATVFASEPLTSSVGNFYMTDAITKASATMARCSKAKATGSAF
jgi:NADH dehydrogenase/NADH:ubiquinone oxidoreductase subunit G